MIGGNMNYSRFGLGRIPSPLDIRDYKLTDYVPKDLGDLSGNKAWPFNGEPLDQGETGHCVGFGGADFGINDPIQDNYTNQDGHNFYYKCKIVDGEPNLENGSTVRSIAKVLQQVGRITNYAFATSIDEVTYWLLNQGPVIVGIPWTEGMFTPDENNIIHPTGKVVGGHCVVLDEKTSTGLYGIQNSWDNMWGINGKAYISIADFSLLFRSSGEVMTAVENPITSPDPETKECWFITFLKALGISI
jgi:hypothetical protein